MSANPKKRAAKKKKPKVTREAGGNKGSSAAARTAPPALPHKPGVTPGSVDVTGIVPEDVHADPDITEGHPGYEESGGSEIHPGR
jgi:hypothetical protein